MRHRKERSRNAVALLEMKYHHMPTAVGSETKPHNYLKNLGVASPGVIIYSNKSTNQMHQSLRFIAYRLTLILLTWRKW